MYLKKVILIIVLLYYCSSVFSQKVVFLDEKSNEISSVTYHKKCRNKIFKCYKYETDTLIINKILHKYTFGKIKKEEYNQIKQLLELDGKSKINKEATLLIKFYDTLSNYTIKKRRHDEHMIKYHGETDSSLYSSNPRYRNYPNLRKPNTLAYTKDNYEESIENFDKKFKKCKKRFEKKFNAKVLFVYKHGDDMKGAYPNINFIRDRGIIKRNFFSIMYNYNFLLLKPDGEYFLSGWHLDDKTIDKLLKSNNWFEYIEDWKQSINKPKSQGIFSKNHITHSKPHCF